MVKRRKTGFLVLVMILVCVFPAALPAGSLQEGKPGPGDPAPLFTTADLDGNRVCLDEIVKAGKVVLINFWGLRCANCIEEIGYLNPLYEKYGQGGVVFLGVNVDGVKADIIRQMMPKLPNVPVYTVLADPGFVIPDLYNMSAAPLSFVIGRDGKVVYRHEDFQPGDEVELENSLKKAVAAGK